MFKPIRHLLLSLACTATLTAPCTQTASATPPPQPDPASALDARLPASGPGPDESPIPLDATVVTGSRIPRAELEGPAPISVITAADIEAGGYVSVPDVLQALTQNSGQTQSQQSAGASDFAPGAQQVDLRALGPNHTLVLVNGRRIADFPMPFGGRSNFTDVSSLPLGMIDRIEILTGSASAIYGSDAISGVVNFILKQKADGTTVDYRYGQTGRGDAASFRINLSSGLSRGDFNAVFGAEYLHQEPLWGYQRSRQDSSFDAPTRRSRVPRRNFLITDWRDDYIDPGQAACDALSHLDGGTLRYAERPNYGYFCGSDRSVAYRTMTSKRDGFNGYASLSYDTGAGELFAELQLGRHELNQFKSPRDWTLMTPDGNESGYFYNQASDRIEYWQRIFTLEEMGGLGRGMVETRQKTFSLTTGYKGRMGENWNYEASFSHSRYSADISWPQIVSARANALFLGPQLGEHLFRGVPYPIFNADPARLYTPLTRAEYDHIAAHTTYHPETLSHTLAFTLVQDRLFPLPGGSAGFAATAEFGRQSYAIHPDPLATQYHYYSWRDSDGEGSRRRWAMASELTLPLLEHLNLSLAGRYDQYRFAGHDPGRFTWSAGLEWRPLSGLLLRGSYGTAFRAPDLHYVFTGLGNDQTRVRDYYRCDTEEPGQPDCSFDSERIIRSRDGNRSLNPETSRSWTAGVVWSPLDNIDVSLDYFSIHMRDQVQDLSSNDVMRTERDCRLGSLDPNSALCLETLARITRLGDGSLYGVHVNPINIAWERTSGIDLSSTLRWDTGIGSFSLSGNYTWVRAHEIQTHPDEAVIDMFAINSGYDIPRNKASLRLSWNHNAWGASIQGMRMGRLPNDDSYHSRWRPSHGTHPWIPATYRYNANLQYAFTDHARLALSVVNLFDKMPPHDPTYTGYPYYDVAWFDTRGRSFYLQYTHTFGSQIR